MVGGAALLWLDEGVHLTSSGSLALSCSQALGTGGSKADDIESCSASDSTTRKEMKQGKESTYRNLAQKYCVSSLVAPLHRVNHVRFRIPGIFQYHLAVRKAYAVIPPAENIRRWDVAPRGERGLAPEYADALREDLGRPVLCFAGGHVVVED